MHVVKFLSVLVMIYIHAHFFLLSTMGVITQEQLSSALGEKTKIVMFIGLFLTILPILSGFVFRISGNFTFLKSLPISLGLLFAGFCMNTLIWGIDSNYSWNILQLTAISFSIISLLKKYFSDIAIMVFSGVIILCSETVRLFSLEYLSHTPATVLFFGGENTYNIMWPVFPWIGMILFGFSFAHYYVESKNKKVFLQGSLLAGLCLVGDGMITGDINPELTIGPVFTSALTATSTIWLLSTLGFFLILFYIGERFFSKNTFSKYGLISSFSSSILFVYITQMFFGVVFSIIAKNSMTRMHADLYTHYFYIMIPMLVAEVLLCWGVGAFFIRLLLGTKIVVSLKKM